MLEALKSDNMLWRMHAQRLLVEKGDKSVIPALIKLATDKSVDETGLNPAAIHALWTIEGLNGFDGTNADANAAAVADLKHPSAGVRRAAVDVLPRNAESAAALLASECWQIPMPQVRKAGFSRTLGNARQRRNRCGGVRGPARKAERRGSVDHRRYRLRGGTERRRIPPRGVCRSSRQLAKPEHSGAG